MKNQMTICKKCGSSFDIGAEGYYNKKTHCYFCAACGDALIKRAGETQIGLKRTAGGTVAKLLLAISLIFPMGEDIEDPMPFAASMFIAAMAILWAILPFVGSRKLGDRAKNRIDMLFKAGLILFCIWYGILMGEFFDLVLGALLAFSAAVAGARPYIMARKAREEAQNLVPASASPEANRGRTCPHCGAPITGNRCEYCGSEF